MSTKGEKQKNIETLIRAVAVAQNKGAFSLKDASSLHKVISSFSPGNESNSISEIDAVNALVQGTVIGQKNGSYNLEDANVIFNAVKYIEENDTKPNDKLETVSEEPEQKIKEL